MQKDIVPDEGMRAFFDSAVRPVIDMLINRECLTLLVQARFDGNLRAIQARYGKRMRFVMSDTPSLDAIGKHILPMACKLIDGDPAVVMFIPHVQVGFVSTLNKYGSRDGLLRFRRHNVVSVLHEMDHLVFGISDSDSLTDIDAVIEIERQVWGQTCEFAIRPYFEAGLRLTEHEEKYFEMWCEAGRNADHPTWRDFIRSQYVGLKRIGR